MSLTVTEIVPRTVIGPLSMSVIKVETDDSHLDGGEALDLSDYCTTNVYSVLWSGTSASSLYVPNVVLGTEASGGGFPGASVKLDFLMGDNDAVADGPFVSASTKNLSAVEFYFTIFAD